ncbi:MAG: NAD-dependent epimerase/dehydratase family protein [Nocardiopsaceae bacterium]|nr:NAD-dependent epimerase/dehydratase family protein [Nocardiopsaceae bacterium]
MGKEFRRAVVTGGAGFLGTVACRMLLEQGTEVVCVDNLLTSINGDPASGWPAGGESVGSESVHGEAARGDPGAWGGLDFRRQDVTEPFEVDGPVDLVLHLASPASPADYHHYPLRTLEAGSAGTRNAVELAGRKGARFVLASTSEVYGDPEVSPQRERYYGNVDPVGPRSVYDEAKRYAEALTAAYGRAGRADTAIARIFNTYGPGMRPGDGRMVPTFACQALRGEPVTVTGDGTQTRSLCYVTDTVRGLLLLAASDLSGPVNIGNPDEASVAEIAARIIALAGSDSPIRHVPLPRGDPQVRKPDITLARAELGFEPLVGWREGLGETLEWFRRAIGVPAPEPARVAEVPE